MQTTYNNLLEKILKLIIIIGSFLVVAIPLIVIPGSYFPYIIQKTLILRILIELIFACYLVLALWKPAYRPQKSLILWSVLAFALVMVITTFTSQSIARSWWGNWERSFGTFTYLHFFAWFFVLISVFKKIKYWNRILNFSLIISVVICLYALSQRLGLSFALETGLARVNGTIGNAAFLASYLLFHVFIAILFFIEKSGWKWKIYYLLIFLIDLFVLFLTGTRGAQLALLFSVAVLIILLFILKIWRQKAIKFLLFGCLALFILIGVLFYFKHSNFVENNYHLRRITNFSFNDNTVQTRLRSWKWGFWGFRDNLLFGAGPENYQNVFNQYFEPDFYDYTGNEIWFDRAHNTLVDMASTMGIFGLLTYLAIFGAAAYCLNYFRKVGFIKPLIFIILILLFFSYFFQNIIVFDSLNSLIPFYLLLAYIHYLYLKSRATAAVASQKDQSMHVSPYLSLLIFGLLFVFSFFTFSLQEIKANLIVYDAYISAKLNKYEKSIDAYDKVYPITINKLDPAILLSSSLNEMIGKNTGIASKEVEIKDLEKAVDWLNKAIELDSKDMFLYYLQAKNYSLLAELTREVKYIEQGIKAAEIANQLSPGRVRPFWMLAQLYLFGGQPQKALTYLEQAENLNPRLAETYFYKSVVYESLNDQEKAYEQYDQMIDRGYRFFNIGQIKKLIPYYEEKADLKRLISLVSNLTDLEPNDPNNWQNLVNLLDQDEQYDEALRILQKAADAIPAFSSRAYARYQEILKKKNEAGTQN